MGLMKTRRHAYARRGLHYTANWQFSVCKGLKQMGYNVDLNCFV